MATQANVEISSKVVHGLEGSLAKVLFQTDNTWSSLLLRVMLGLLMFPHGAQKLLGWFCGVGFGGTMGVFTQKMNLPAPLAFLIILGESVGSLILIVGFLTRFAALSLATIMVGAIALVHWPNGFFMNWFGQQAGEGFEYHLMVIAIAASLVLSGGGRWSVDRKIAETLN